MLREQVFNTKIAHPCSLIYYNYLTFIQSSLTSVLNYLYPKIFPVHDLDMHAEQGVALFHQAWPASGRSRQLHNVSPKEPACF